MSAVDPPNASADKTALRVELQRRRNAVSPPERHAFSQRACTIVAEHLRGLQVAVVALYAAIRSELDTSELAESLRRLGIRIAYPRVIGGTRTLQFSTSTTDQLVVDRFGIPSPAADAPPIPIADIDCFVVPGLAFDKRGNRLGWGRGYYDQTLALHSRAMRIGICFSLQLLASLPDDEHDIRMTAIATEEGLVAAR